MVWSLLQPSARRRTPLLQHMVLMAFDHTMQKFGCVEAVIVATIDFAYLLTPHTRMNHAHPIN